MSAIKYIGRTTYLRGKRLFDVLARLKGFGVGRVVYRQVFHERYPEPSYYRITRVEPNMSDPNEAEIDIAPRGKSRAYGLKVWRGAALGEQPITLCHKNDWRLVHRLDEEKFLSHAVPVRQPSTMPEVLPFPPLFEHLLLIERRRGQPMAAKGDGSQPMVIKDEGNEPAGDKNSSRPMLRMVRRAETHGLNSKSQSKN